MDNILDEGVKSGNIQNIKNSSYHIYSHLMKIVMINNILTGWIGTIFEQNKQLIDITNKSHWISAKQKMDYIKNKAIKEYTDDGNSNGEIAFNIVYNDFPNIELFKDKELLRNYIIKCINKKSISARDKDELINYVKSK